METEEDPLRRYPKPKYRNRLVDNLFHMVHRFNEVDVVPNARNKGMEVFMPMGKSTNGVNTLLQKL